MKIKKIILINILIFLTLFFLAEFFCYKYLHINYWNRSFFKAYTYLPVKDYKTFASLTFDGIENSLGFREDIKLKNIDKSPILLFGCSFTYGEGLNSKQTFSAKLQNYTNRMVYNRGIPSTSINTTLFLLRNGVAKTINDVPDIIIYTYMYDQVRRLFIECSFHDDPNIYYKYKTKTELEEKTDMDLWYWHSYLLRELNRRYTYKMLVEKKNDVAKFFLAHIIAVNIEIKKLYPYARFLIFVYNNDSYIKSMEKTLKRNGIEVIYLSELSNIDFSTIEYQISETDEHPNELAWDKIVPLLSKRLNL